MLEITIAMCVGFIFGLLVGFYIGLSGRIK